MNVKAQFSNSTYHNRPQQVNWKYEHQMYQTFSNFFNLTIPEFLLMSLLMFYLFMTLTLAMSGVVSYNCEYFNS